jgi:ADP-heptose:LPS heptosyltransferase
LLESISASELALELVNQCLRGGDWPRDLLETLLRCTAHPDEGQAREASRALFSIVVERLADLFEPALCDTYASIFSNAIEFAFPELSAADIVERYKRIRAPRRFEGQAERVRDVFVLSRVTLGADVAITSVVLDAAKRKFPGARIHFVGPRKSWEMFCGDRRLRHVPVSYARAATLRERLSIWPALRGVLGAPGAVVIDPDSRLTQLGLLDVCPEENYYFFESRSYGEYDQESLTNLTRRWVRETFGVEDAKPYLHIPERAPVDVGGAAAVSFGVGENPSKRIRNPFEEELLRGLLERDLRVVIDKGEGGEEARRVERAVERCGGAPHHVAIHEGAFAPFALTIAHSRLYVGYDSAGQHVAAAAGTPLVTVFSGYVNDRMYHRWQPTGPGPSEVVRVEESDPKKVLAETLAAVDLLLGR